jgi:hypothetical protein
MPQQQTTTSVETPTATVPAPSQRHWLLVISVLLALLVVGVWSREAPTTAMAEDKPSRVPPVTIDLAVQQRYDVISELQRVNGKLDRLGDLLSSGQVKVIVVQDEKKAEEVRHEATSKP